MITYNTLKDNTLFVIEGNIIQISEKGECKIAKIKFESGFAETSFKLNDDIHLGDCIRLKGVFITEEKERIFK